mmetsp:Transcript_27867/g.78800  ORF Transcript_27867/g.78800 Transcript_27867/m.78800 type:complete len:97 (-) Transcript_27867:1857-2147(-)
MQEFLRRVEVLLLKGCDSVTDEICSRLQSVVLLDLSFCPEVTDRGLADLTTYSPALNCLHLARKAHNLWSCGRWTEEGLAALRAAAPQVQVCLTDS